MTSPAPTTQEIRKLCEELTRSEDVQVSLINSSRRIGEPQITDKSTAYILARWCLDRLEPMTDQSPDPVVSEIQERQADLPKVYWKQANYDCDHLLSIVKARQVLTEDEIFRLLIKNISIDESVDDMGENPRPIIVGWRDAAKAIIKGLTTPTADKEGE